MTGAAVSRRWECEVDFGADWLVSEPGAAADLDAWLAGRPDLAPRAEELRTLRDQACAIAFGGGAVCVGLLVATVGDELRYGVLQLTVTERDLPDDPRAALAALRADDEEDDAVFPGSWQGELLPLDRGGDALRIRVLDAGDGGAPEPQPVYEVVEYLVSSEPGGPVAHFVFLTPALDVGEELIEVADLVVGTFRWEGPA